MAQRYGTIAAHTRCRASVLVVFVVFCVHMYSFACLIRRTPLPTFSDTAITNRHSDTTISSSELTGCGYPGLLDRKNRSDMCAWWESNPRLPACKASTLSTGPGSPRQNDTEVVNPHFIVPSLSLSYHFHAQCQMVKSRCTCTTFRIAEPQQYKTNKVAVHHAKSLNSPSICPV